MRNLSATAGERAVTIDYPDDWFAFARCVPNLVFPQELFGVSTHDLPATPKQLDQPRPMVSSLPAEAILIWCYAQGPGDGPSAHELVAPDYSRFGLPLTYEEARAYPAYTAREWDPASFIWKRIGVSKGDVSVTVWIWEGTAAPEANVMNAREVVSSLRIG